MGQEIEIRKEEKKYEKDMNEIGVEPRTA